MKIQTHVLKNFDLALMKEGLTYLAGVDEAGRGPLSGPVVAAAVLFGRDTFIDGINDSKKLSEKRRLELSREIKDKALCFKISIIDNLTIDKINILQASLLAMKNASEALIPTPEIVLIDGNRPFQTNIAAWPIVKGDQKSFAIAAASILAKTTRDEIMLRLSEEYPQYNWQQNKGYPTQQHIEAVKQFGPSPFHRQTFIRKFL